MKIMAKPVAASRWRFRDELADFAGFIVRPRFGPRLPGRTAGDGWREDWFPALSVGRLVQWALFLWAVNLLFLGPLAVYAATAGGAQYRLNMANIPWLHALLWAPVVEELVFRYGLRHSVQALWVVPAALCALLVGPHWASSILVAAILLGCWWHRLGWRKPMVRVLPWRYRLGYRRWFPLVFHLSSLLFAAVHLNNFSFHQTPYWLMPLLVLPQWLTGMVLGWERVKRGIGASMLLHGIFNAGPLLLIWLVLRSAPQLAK